MKFSHEQIVQCNINTPLIGEQTKQRIKIVWSVTRDAVTNLCLFTRKMLTFEDGDLLW